MTVKVLNLCSEMFFLLAFPLLLIVMERWMTKKPGGGGKKLLEESQGLFRIFWVDTAKPVQVT